MWGGSRRGRGSGGRQRRHGKRDGKRLAAGLRTAVDDQCSGVDAGPYILRNTVTSTVPPFTAAAGLTVSQLTAFPFNVEAVQLKTPPPLLLTCTVLVCAPTRP